MSRTQFTAEEFFADLDDLGEAVVRERLIAGIYGSGNQKKELAQEWLRRREIAREAAAESEKVAIAARAADAASRAASAAEEQARLARTANTRATIALVIAIGTAIVAIIDMFV